MSILVLLSMWSWLFVVEYERVYFIGSIFDAMLIIANRFERYSMMKRKPE